MGGSTAISRAAGRRAEDLLRMHFPDDDVFTFFIDSACLTHGVSEAAAAFLGASRTLRIHHGKLVHTNSEMNFQLQGLIVGAVARNLPGRLGLPGEWGESFIVTAAPHPDGRAAGRQVAARIERRHAFRSAPLNDLRNIFGLSAAEAKLLQQLIIGQQLADCAALFGLAPNTVRNQLASVMRKMGCSRQSEVVRLGGLLT